MPPVLPAFAAPVSTVGEVTSSDTTAVPAEPSAVSQDRVCALKMTCNLELCFMVAIFFLLLCNFFSFLFQPTGLKRPSSPKESEKESKKPRLDNAENSVCYY